MPKMTQEDTYSTRELQVSNKWSLKAAVNPTATQTGWAITNLDPTTARTHNCDALLADVMDSFGQLVDDLKAKGILSA